MSARKIQIRITAVEGTTLLTDRCETIEVVRTTSSNSLPFKGFLARSKTRNGSTFGSTVIGACVMAMLEDGEL